MNTIPSEIYKQFLFYLIPTISINISYNYLIHRQDLFFLAILSSILPYFISSKISLIFGSIFVLFAILFPTFYYFAYGFILSHIYNNNILLSNRKYILNNIIFKIEIISLIISQTIYIPILIQIFIAFVGIICCIYVDPPSSETDNPFLNMKLKILSNQELNLIENNNIKRDDFISSNLLLKNKTKEQQLLENKLKIHSNTPINKNLLDLSNLLSKEYKIYIKNKNISKIKIDLLNTKYKIIKQGSFGLFYFMQLLNGHNIWLYIFMMFNFYKLKFITLAIIASIIVFNIQWEYLGIFGNFETNELIIWRMCSGYFIFLLIRFIMRYFM